MSVVTAQVTLPKVNPQPIPWASYFTILRLSLPPVKGDSDVPHLVELFQDCIDRA